MGPELAIPLLFGVGGAAASALASKGGAAAPPPINIPAQPAPSQQPGDKPKKPGMQQSFMTSAAGAQLPPSVSGAGAGAAQKTLLGA